MVSTAVGGEGVLRTYFLPCRLVFACFQFFSTVIGVAWCKYEQLRSADTSVWENTVKSPCSSPQLCAHAPTHTHILTVDPAEWDHTSAHLHLTWRGIDSGCAGKLWKTLANISRYSSWLWGGSSQPGPAVCPGRLLITTSASAAGRSLSAVAWVGEFFFSGRLEWAGGRSKGARPVSTDKQ